jgi:hypothetical protein
MGTAAAVEASLVQQLEKRGLVVPWQTALFKLLDQSLFTYY